MPFDPDNFSTTLQPDEFDLKKGVEVEPQQRFDTPQFNDKWAALVFFVHLGVTFLYGLGGIILYMQSDDSQTNEVQFTFDLGDATMAGGILLVSLLVGIISAVGFFLVTLKKPVLLIYFSYLVYFLMMLCTAVIILATGILASSVIFIIFGIILLLFVIVMGLCMFLLRKSAALTAAYLKVSADILIRFKSMIFVLILGMVLYILYASFWTTMFVFSIYYEVPAVIFIGSFWLLFSWFWTTQIIVGVMRSCVAGVVGYFYYANNEEEMEHSVSRAFKRSLTSSFGSICFGTLITAVLQSLVGLIAWARVMNASRNTQNFAQLVLKCIVCMFLLCAQAFVQHLVRLTKFFNKYAFTFIGIYGLKFTDAGYATIKLLVTNGLVAILNESNMNFVILAQMLSIACITFVTNTSLLALLSLLNDGLDPNVWMAGEVIGVILSVGVGMIGTEILSYCLPAILICSSHEPTRMQSKTPELYELLAQRYPDLVFLERVTGVQV